MSPAVQSKSCAAGLLNQRLFLGRRKIFRNQIEKSGFGDIVKIYTKAVLTKRRYR